MPASEWAMMRSRLEMDYVFFCFVFLDTNTGLLYVIPLPLPHLIILNHYIVVLYIFDKND